MCGITVKLIHSTKLHHPDFLMNADSAVSLSFGCLTSILQTRGLSGYSFIHSIEQARKVDIHLLKVDNKPSINTNHRSVSGV